MKKLLHERLRELKGRGCSELASLAGVSCQAYCVSDACHKDIYKAIADEIEKYYIPRPRFEDGEPVQFDGEVEGCNGLVDAMLIFRDGSGYVYGREDNPFHKPIYGAPIEDGLERPSDSLEKVQDTIDALANVYESDDRLCDDLHNISDRITALIERGA